MTAEERRAWLARNRPGADLARRQKIVDEAWDRVMLEHSFNGWALLRDRLDPEAQAKGDAYFREAGVVPWVH